MSVQAISWALAVKAGNPAAKCVLIVLANYANEDGVCWPPQTTIAEQTEQSIDTVQRRLTELVNAKLLTRERRQNKNGGRTTDSYRLVMPQLAAKGGVKPQPAAGGLNRTVAVYTDEPSLSSLLPLGDSLPLRLKEVSEERSGGWPPDWEKQFRKRYPRNVAMADAIRRLDKIRKKKLVAFDVIINAVDVYAASVAETDMKYICHPTTWINRGRWGDDEKSLDLTESNGNNGFASLARKFAGL